MFDVHDISLYRILKKQIHYWSRKCSGLSILDCHCDALWLGVEWVAV